MFLTCFNLYSILVENTGKESEHKGKEGNMSNKLKSRKLEDREAQKILYIEIHQ